MSRRRWWVPEVVQTSMTDCGPACLSSALTGVGVPASYGWLREACATGADGTSIDTLEELAQRLGADAEQVLEPVDHIVHCEAAALPAIAVVAQPSGDNHFVVVWRRCGGRVMVMDPAIGRTWWSLAELERRAYRHAAELPESTVEAWLRSDGFVAVLGRRLRAIGGARAARLLDPAQSAAGWRPLAALDAACRLVAELIAGGAVPRGRATARLLGALARRAADAPETIPAHCWSVTEGANNATVRVRGAVLLRIMGLRAGTRSEILSRARTVQRPWQQLAALVAPLRPALAPVLFGLTLVTLAIGLDSVALRAMLGLVPRLQGSGQLLCAVVALAVIGGVLLTLEMMTLARIRELGRVVEGAARAALYRTLARLPLSYMRSRPASDLADRVHQIHMLRQLPVSVAKILRSGGEVVICGALLAVLVPTAWWIVLLGTAGTLMVAIVFHGPLSRHDLRVRTHAGAMSKYYLDAMQGALPAQAHGCERAMRAAHDEVLAEWKRAGLESTATATAAEGVLMVVAIATAAGTLRCLGDHPVAAPLAAFWTLTFVVSGLRFLTYMREMPGHRNLVLRMLEPLAHTPADPAPKLAVTIDAPVSVSLRDVTVIASGIEILRDVNLELGAGEHVAVVGSSGAGKSTLVGLLLGWVAPARGEVSVDGVPLAAVLDALRARTAWADETAYLWNRTLIDNVILDGADAVCADHAILDAGLVPIVAAGADGLARPVGEGGARLSGGEGQRVRLARALARPEPALVLLDEALRGLDLADRRRLTTAARRRWSDRTLLLVTHDIGETTSMPRVIVVEDGRIVEDGAPEHLLARVDGRYRTMVESAASARSWASAWRSCRLENGRLREVTHEADIP